MIKKAVVKKMASKTGKSAVKGGSNILSGLGESKTAQYIVPSQSVSPMVKGILLLTAVFGGLYLVKKLMEGVGDYKDDKSQRDQLNNEITELEKEQKTKPPTLTKSQANSMANVIHTAMDGYGTDEDAIVTQFRKIKNNADYLLVSSAYGIKKVSSGRFNPEPDYKGNMAGALASELSDYWIKKLNEILKKNGVTKYSV